MEERDNATVEEVEDWTSSDLTARIIGCAFKVANTLGCGFFEKVYENAMVLELRRSGLEVAQQVSHPVIYDGAVVGEYIADLIVANEVIVEIKAISGLEKIHEAQCINYLKASGRQVCLLINFGRPKIEIRRLVL